MPPQLVTDYKALVGDPSDNIPGVPPGDGPKTATRLLAEYGSLEALLEQAGQVKGKTGRALAEHREAALQGKLLTTIRCDVPIELDLDRARVAPPEGERVRALFQELEFGSLLRRVAELFPGIDLAPGSPGPEGVAAGSGEAGGPRAEALLLESPEALARWLAALPPQEPVAFEWLVEGSDALAGPLVGLAVARPGQVAFLPLPGELPEDGPLREQLAAFLASPRPKVVHDVKRQILIAGRWGLTLEPPAFDLMLAGYLLRPGEGGYEPETLARTWLGEELPSLQEPAAGRGKRLEPLTEVVPPGAGRAAGRPARPVRRPAAAAGNPAGGRWPPGALPGGGTAPGVGPGGHGGPGHPGGCGGFGGLEPGAGRPHRGPGPRASTALAGEEFNLNSPKQLGPSSSTSWACPSSSGPRRVRPPRGGAGRAGRAASVRRACPGLPAAGQAEGPTSTPCRAHPPRDGPGPHHLQPDGDGHRAALQLHPNLQNIPIRTEEGRAHPGGLRAGRAGLGAPHRRLLPDRAAGAGPPLGGRGASSRPSGAGTDIHARTAAEVFGVPPRAVTPSSGARPRPSTSASSTGSPASAWPGGLGSPRAEAQAYIDGYFARYPASRVHGRGGGAGPGAGLCHHPSGPPALPAGAQGRNRARRSFAERTAMNTPIQGSAADIIKLAMLRVDRRLQAVGPAGKDAPSGAR